MSQAKEAMPRVSKSTASGGILSQAAAPLVPEATMAQTPAADAFSSRQRRTATAQALDTTASASSPPAVVGSGSGAGVAGGMYPLNSAAPPKTAEAIAQPQLSASAGAVAAKRERASAFAGVVSGNLMKTPIAHWSISSTGQLQRRNWDDTLSVIEPAAGAIFRAVAAQGIEVWAGGSQAAGSHSSRIPQPLDLAAPSRQVRAGAVTAAGAAAGNRETRGGGGNADRGGSAHS